MRVYVPTTMHLLMHALEDGHVPADTAYAVTPTLREWYVGGDEEELEYVAMTAAARAALRLLAERPSDRARRVVVALDVPDGAVASLHRGDRAAVALNGPPELADVVSAHVDDADAEPAVLAAVAALPAAADGDADAEFLLDAVEDHELAWYAAQEIPALVAAQPS